MKNILAIAILLLLLTHPSLALEGASQGLILWSQTVLPTLLPFMICSNVIVSIGALPLFMTPFRPVLSRLLGLSDNGGYVLVSGLLCGYPMGAKTCAEFLSQGKISPGEARYLLAISNHSSPMFLLGYVAANLCPQIPIWTVMAALYLPILPLAALARKIYRPNSGTSDTYVPADSRAAFCFDDIMMGSIEIMVRIGGYIMLFSILAVFIQYLPGIAPVLKSLLLGISEITTGIHALAQTTDGFLQGLCLTGAIAFGGLSGIFQTKSVLENGLQSFPSENAKNAGLSIRHYVLWKLLHTAVSCLIFILLAGFLPSAAPTAVRAL